MMATFQPWLAGVALIHAEQIAGEQRRLVAAGAAADFEDDGLFVGLVLGQQQDADGLVELLDFLVELGDFGLGHVAHVLVAGLEQVLGLDAGRAWLSCRRRFRPRSGRARHVPWKT